MRTRRWSSNDPRLNKLRSVPLNQHGIFRRESSHITRETDFGRCSGDLSTRHFLLLRVPTPILVVVLLSVMAALLSGCGASEAEERNGAGVVHANRDRLEEAIAEFDGALLLDPEFVLAHHNRGESYLILGESKRAIQDFEEAIRLDPGFAPAYTSRGWAYFALSEYERAIQDYDESIRLDPEHAPAYYSRGGAYLKLGQRDRAIQDYEKAIRLDRRLALDDSSRC